MVGVMTKTQAIRELANMKTELTLMPTFKGRAAMIKKIRGSIRYLQKYAVGGNIPQLIVNERTMELESIKPKGERIETP